MGLTSRWMILWVVFSVFSPMMVERVILRNTLSGMPPVVELVDGAPVHVLDAHVYGALLEESAVEINDVGRDAFVKGS